MFVFVFILSGVYGSLYGGEFGIMFVMFSVTVMLRISCRKNYRHFSVVGVVHSLGSPPLVLVLHWYVFKLR